jgi:Tfp pilus assembly protein PilF
MVMLLLGRVAADDGAALPNDVLVERVCNARVRQQVHTSLRGDFSMQLGAMSDSLLDASGSGSGQYPVTSKTATSGIPRRELATCDLRVSSSGFRPSVIGLAGLTPQGANINVGAIVIERVEKIKAQVISATPYKAPKEARKAYEKGLEAAGNGKLVNARDHFEKAVAIYPKFTDAWFELGSVLQKENQKDAARAAYTRATTIDAKFLPPYLRLTLMAFDGGEWAEVVELTSHILAYAQFANVSGYLLEADTFNYADAYFYNSIANYKLNKIDEAEKSALKAEQILRTRSPQLHLLLAEIFTRRNNYAKAATELETYLELAPHAQNANRVREELTRLEKLAALAPSAERKDPVDSHPQ